MDEEDETSLQHKQQGSLQRQVMVAEPNCTAGASWVTGCCCSFFPVWHSVSAANGCLSK